MSNFQRTQVASPELLIKAKDIYNLPDRHKLGIELGLQLPLSQIVDPKAGDVRFPLEDYQYTDTIPLALLSSFPKGEILLAVFDSHDAINNDDVIRFLQDRNVTTRVVESYEGLDAKELINSVKGLSRKLLPSDRTPVGWKHFQAYKVLEERLANRKFKRFILLNEVRSSKTGWLIPENVFDPYGDKDREVAEYIEKTSFDILVFDEKNMEPILAVEYDGPHHQNDDDQVRKDEFKNYFCEAIGLPLIRIGDLFLDPSPSEVDQLTQELLKTELRQALLLHFLHNAGMELEKQRRRNTNFQKEIDRLKSGISEHTGLSFESYKEFLDQERYEEGVDKGIEIRERNFRYSKIFGHDPLITYEENARFGGIKATISWKKGRYVTPAWLKLRAYGIPGIEDGQIVKDFLAEWLIDLQISSRSP